MLAFLGWQLVQLKSGVYKDKENPGNSLSYYSLGLEVPGCCALFSLPFSLLLLVLYIKSRVFS
jgi:hypothetical protein